MGSEDKKKRGQLGMMCHLRLEQEWREFSCGVNQRFVGVGIYVWRIRLLVPEPGTRVVPRKRREFLFHGTRMGTNRLWHGRMAALLMGFRGRKEKSERTDVHWPDVQESNEYE